MTGRKIAKVSGTPGKTRMLNVYLMPGLGAHALYVLDLPGYGYSRASQAERRAFRLLISHVLERPRLAGVLWLLDIRRDPSDEDRAMQELFAGRATRVLAALTKSDKLPRGQRVNRERELREALALDDDQVIVTSAQEKEGIVELREAIGRLASAAQTE
jgi:GTP-binding protein